MVTPSRAGSSVVCCGHPGGSVAVNVTMDTVNGELDYVVATVFRTARRLADGFVYVPASLVA
jgi:2-methylaconitate cis-trans-isomerase PrpF